MKKNIRGAGRKRALPTETIRTVKERFEAGETPTALAKEYGVSRQTLSSYVHPKEPEVERVCCTYRAWAKLNAELKQENLWDYTLRIDYMNYDVCCTVILVDFLHGRILIRDEG